MVKYIVKAVLKLVMILVNVILTPLDLLIKSLIPDLSNVFVKINAFFDLLISYGKFGISYFGFTTETISIIVLLLTSIVMIPLGVHTVKLAIKWYNQLKP